MGGPAIVSEIMPIHPNVCARCGTGNNADTLDEFSRRKLFLDTGVTFDFEGALYFCDKCFADFAAAFPGYYTQKQVDSLIMEMNSAVEAGKQALETLDIVQTYLAYLGFNPAGLISAAHRHVEEIDNGFRENVLASDGTEQQAFDFSGEADGKPDKSDEPISDSGAFSGISGLSIS